MIEYSFEEERIMALHFADVLADERAKEILQKGSVANAEEATHLSEFYWRMVDQSVQDAEAGVELPVEGGAEIWTEKLLITFGGYLEGAGFEQQWNTAINNA